MTEVVRILEPTGGPAPVVFDSPHSGDLYPADFGSILPEAVLRSGWDAYVDELFAAAPACGATLIAAQFPRTYIDPNRAPEDLDAAMVDGTWPGPIAAGPKTRVGKGLIWRTIGADKAIYDRKLTPEEIHRRITTYWRPYNEAVRRAVDSAHARWGGVWHINCHSMPSVWGQSRAGGGEPVTSDFILGDRDGTTCAPEFTAFVCETLTAMGYRVAVNDRMKGVEIVRANGRPSQNRHSLQIEITRRCYMDERTLERNGGFARLRADLDALVAAVCTFALERVENPLPQQLRQSR